MAKRPKKQHVSAPKSVKLYDSSSHAEKSEDEEKDTSDSSSDTSETPPTKKSRTTNLLKVDDSGKKATVSITAVDEGVENTNKLLFQRVFTEKDEIVLLEGLSSYMQETEVDVTGAINMIGFHEYIKDSISTPITKIQLSEKIKRLKRRFKTNQGRVLTPDSHEEKVFELSRKIWGIKSSVEKSVPTTKTNPLSMFGSLGAFTEADVARFGLSLSEIRNHSELGEDLKKKLMELKAAECELMVRQNLLRNEKIKLFMEVFK